jgi:hypothetical protein
MPGAANGVSEVPAKNVGGSGGGVMAKKANLKVAILAETLAAHRLVTELAAKAADWRCCTKWVLRLLEGPPRH